MADPTVAAREHSSGGRLGYQPALDGLRALSVLVVLAYHADIRWLPGGFLGVEVFFVISGYLITALLVEERARTGRIDLRGFWVRRARRLLPALWLLLVTVPIVAAVVARDAFDSLRAEVLAAFGYVTNWYLVLSDTSYFAELGRPPLLRHLWSLAVEEQWYLAWPLVFAVATTLVRGRTRALVLPFAAAAVASAVWMAVLFTPDVDPSRAYYGTDTRAAGLLVGAALACFWAPWRTPQRRIGGVELEALALGSLAVLGAAVVWADEYQPLLYQGGFLVVALCTATVIAATVDDRCLALRRVLGTRPLVAIGVRSYGLYLWHWPVFMLLRPQDVGLDGPGLLVLRGVVTAVCTEASYRLVELPVRRGVIGAWLASRRNRPGVPAPALLAGAALAVVVPLGFVLRLPASGDPAAVLAAGGGATVGVTTVQAGAGTAPAAPVATTLAAPSTRPVVTSTTPATTTAAARTFADLGRPLRVTVVGDSVGLTMVVNAPPDLAASVALTDGTIMGCGIMEGSIRTTARWRRSFEECAGWEAKWSAAAAAGQADVVLVTLGAWEVFDLQMGDSRLSFGSPEWDAYFAGRLQRAIEAAGSTGARVALLEVPCFRPVDGGGLVGLPERGDTDRTGRINAAFAAAAAADPGRVSFVRQPVEWCSDPEVAGALRERWDGVHYDKPGAARVWGTVAPALLGLAPAA